MTWATDRRLDHIDLMLVVHGRVQRGDLVERFGVSPSQASNDLTQFDLAHPGAIEYDLLAKCYTPVRKVYRTLRGNTDRVVKLLAALAAEGHPMGWIETGE